MNNIEPEERLEKLMDLFPDLKMRNEDLVEEFLDTVAVMKDFGYETETGIVDLHAPMKKLRQGSVMLKSVKALKESNSPGLPAPQVYVESKDTYEKAGEMGPAAVCLNMASAWSPGGGVLGGSKAQEEELARRSTLMWSLYRFGKKGEYEKLFSPLPTTPTRLYPIPLFGCIYSPSVAVFKAPKTYRLLDTPILTNVISAAALRNPKLTPQGTLAHDGEKIAAEKIRSVLRCAASNGHRKLVLGAWGCGAYHNPPKEIARLWKEVLAEAEFKGWFEEICFAILDDRNGFTNSTEGNYAIFKSVFGEKGGRG